MGIAAWKNFVFEEKRAGDSAAAAEIAFPKKDNGEGTPKNPRLVAEKRLNEESRERSTPFVQIISPQSVQRVVGISLL